MHGDGMMIRNNLHILSTLNYLYSSYVLIFNITTFQYAVICLVLDKISICLSVSVCPSICLSVWLSIYLSIYLYTCSSLLPSLFIMKQNSKFLLFCQFFLFTFFMSLIITNLKKFSWQQNFEIQMDRVIIELHILTTVTSKVKLYGKKVKERALLSLL